MRMNDQYYVNGTSGEDGGADNIWNKSQGDHTVSHRRISFLVDAFIIHFSY